MTLVMAANSYWHCLNLDSGHRHEMGVGAYLVVVEPMLAVVSLVKWDAHLHPYCCQLDECRDHLIAVIKKE